MLEKNLKAGSGWNLNARGACPSYLTKSEKRPGHCSAVCLVLDFSIQWAIAQPFYVAGRGTEPTIPQGSRVLVYKLASVFRARRCRCVPQLEGVSCWPSLNRRGEVC